MSLLLTLDPAHLPAPLTNTVSFAQGLVEQYGWYMLGAVLAWFALQRGWAEIQSRRGRKQDPEQLEDLTLRVRQTRLAQQAAWVQQQAETAPTRGPAVREMTEEERVLHRKYRKPVASTEEEKLTYSEVFGDLEGFARRRHPGDSSSSSSSSSSAPKPSGSSGFKPYSKPAPSGSSRRFGGGGPKPCGGGGCGR